VCRNRPDETSIVPWKLGLVALQATGTELLVVGSLAQWLCVMGHRWQRESLVHVDASHACLVQIVWRVHEVTVCVVTVTARVLGLLVNRWRGVLYSVFL